jgi:hypothetical protein
MSDELTARQRAIRLRLVGRSVKQICSSLSRGETWFRKWWSRYLEASPMASATRRGRAAT